MGTVFADKDVVLTVAQQFCWSGLTLYLGAEFKFTGSRSTQTITLPGHGKALSWNSSIVQMVR